MLRTQSGLTTEPTRRISKLNEATDTRRMRRSLTTEELAQLLYVARWRPLAERRRETVPVENPTGRATWKLAPLTYGTLSEAVSRARTKLADKQNSKRWGVNGP